MSNPYEPRLVGYQLAHYTYEYLMRAIGLGVFEGPLGAMKVNPNVAPIMAALHQVLAGGEVAITITRPGTPDVAKGLDDNLNEALEESNEINKKVGFYLTVAG